MTDRALDTISRDLYAEGVRKRKDVPIRQQEHVVAGLFATDPAWCEQAVADAVQGNAIRPGTVPFRVAAMLGSDGRTRTILCEEMGNAIIASVKLDVWRDIEARLDRLAEQAEEPEEVK